MFESERKNKLLTRSQLHLLPVLWVFKIYYIKREIQNCSSLCCVLSCLLFTLFVCFIWWWKVTSFSVLNKKKLKQNVKTFPLRPRLWLHFYNSNVCTGGLCRPALPPRLSRWWRLEWGLCVFCPLGVWRSVLACPLLCLSSWLSQSPRFLLHSVGDRDKVEIWIFWYCDFAFMTFDYPFRYRDFKKRKNHFEFMVIFLTSYFWPGLRGDVRKNISVGTIF